MKDPHCSRTEATLVIPGLNGSGDGHWQWHWAHERPGAVTVEQDSWSCPDLASWQQRLGEVLSQHDDVWIVAHSLGCILTAKLADSPLASRVKGALLVAPCDLAQVERLHPCVVNFGEMPQQRLPFPSLVVGSLDDPYMDFATTRKMARLWGSDLVDIGYAGHINIRSGYGRWPTGYELFDLLKGESKRPLDRSLAGRHAAPLAAYF